MDWKPIVINYLRNRIKEVEKEYNDSFKNYKETEQTRHTCMARKQIFQCEIFRIENGG